MTGTRTDCRNLPRPGDTFVDAPAQFFKDKPIYPVVIMDNRACVEIVVKDYATLKQLPVAHFTYLKSISRRLG